MLYDDKKQDYFSSVREDLISLIPIDFKGCNVLEVGCGSGATLYRLKQLGIAETTSGIELFASEYDYHDFIDHLFSENIETIIFPTQLHGTFDIIILGDVLEHLVDPWSSLKKVSELLAVDGLIITSVPNIRYYSVVKSILFDGDFKYKERGILDKTHLRFFCKKNIVELLENADLKISLITSLFDNETIRSKKYWLNKVTLGIFHDFFVYQFLVTAKKRINNVDAR